MTSSGKGDQKENLLREVPQRTGSQWLIGRTPSESGVRGEDPNAEPERKREDALSKKSEASHEARSE